MWDSEGCYFDRESEPVDCLTPLDDMLRRAKQNKPIVYRLLGWMIERI